MFLKVQQVQESLWQSLMAQCCHAIGRGYVIALPLSLDT